jgi:acyl-CoA ligase (AMP-forming) (exosortase A-associated)
MAVTFLGRSVSYESLLDDIDRVAAGLIELGIARGERVALYLDKRIETVAATFGIAKAGSVFVPINPLLKPEQVAYIVRDCDVRVIITTSARLEAISEALRACDDLRHVVIVDGGNPIASPRIPVIDWHDFTAHRAGKAHRVIDTDMAAILYTSGSTGMPKGVVLSHRNMVAGAESVVEYLENDASDVILAALPLSFDAGFSQLTTGFHAGARVVLLNYLAPRDVMQAVVKERVSGITGVPPLWIQMSHSEWPTGAFDSLRYIANTGGRMPLETLRALRAALPRTRFFLMYGLTEAFRSTYLPPDEVDRRPASIGKAIPNAEVLVLRPDGTPCAPHEPGELVHRGALVALGYWNDPARTADRFKPLPTGAGGRVDGIVLPEMAVFSGDTVTMDEDGFLYFVGRLDEMIKTSGYRVSPTEVEEAIYATRLVGEVIAYGIEDAMLGQAIAVTVTPFAGTAIDKDALIGECRKRLPAYMIPARVDIQAGPLPRNPNGKIDRKLVAGNHTARLLAEST